MTPHLQTNFIIDREIQRYGIELRSWSQKIRNAQRNVDAFRMASHRPSPGALIRSMGSLWSRERSRADAEVERALSARIDALKAQDKDIDMLMRLTQGHWPRLYRRLADLKRG